MRNAPIGLFGLLLTCTVQLVTALPAAAQTAGAAGALRLVQPYAGDCSITVELPAASNLLDVRIAIDGTSIRLSVLQRAPLVALLQDPLDRNSLVTVTTGMLSASARVDTPPQAYAVPAACASLPQAAKPASLDDRATFEASGYLGSVFDNFAPNEVGGYINQASGTTKSRITAGVEAQYRLIGSDTTSRQLWLSTQTLHGMRTADINCKETPEAAVCRKNASSQDKFLYILEHASTMEAHIDMRFEFATLQVKADTPVRAYFTSRFGFLALEGASKVFNSDAYAVVGILSPKGTFKGSFAQVGWGRSEQFQSVPHANRLKIFGTLAFDLAPGLSQRASSFLSRAGGASRAFIAIAVDRNPGGRAPDAVQTYVGFDFDLRRAFGSM